MVLFTSCVRDIFNVWHTSLGYHNICGAMALLIKRTSDSSVQGREKTLPFHSSTSSNIKMKYKILATFQIIPRFY